VAAPYFLMHGIGAKNIYQHANDAKLILKYVI